VKEKSPRQPDVNRERSSWESSGSPAPGFVSKSPRQKALDLPAEQFVARYQAERTAHPGT